MEIMRKLTIRLEFSVDLGSKQAEISKRVWSLLVLGFEGCRNYGKRQGNQNSWILIENWLFEYYFKILYYWYEKNLGLIENSY